jgi:hypothetical protein
MEFTATAVVRYDLSLGTLLVSSWINCTFLFLCYCNLISTTADIPLHSEGLCTPSVRSLSALGPLRSLPAFYHRFLLLPADYRTFSLDPM